MTTDERIQQAAKKYRNWGKWGKDDQLGTLNYITPEKIIQAARLVRAGPVKESEDIGHAFSQHRVGDGLEAVDLTELWDAAAVPPLPCRFDVATLPRRVTVDDDHLVAATRRQQRERET